MTTIAAKMILHSEAANTGIRLPTVLARYPRWIHAEGRTHRVLSLGEAEEFRTPSPMEDRNLSRNASSSRAIPVSKLVEDVMNDPAIPLFWGANQKGMQAREENTAPVGLPEHCGSSGMMVSNRDAWLFARDKAVEMALAFDKAGYHKQIVNRLLEPFSHINVLFTATEWTNFFALRIHGDAEPHIKLLAEAIRDCQKASIPQVLQPGQWHLPFIREKDIAHAGQRFMGEVPQGEWWRWKEWEHVLEVLKQVSVARCARLSYLTHDGKDTTFEEDFALYERLAHHDPLHASPTEHQATPDEVYGPQYERAELMRHDWHNPHQHGNFVGWRQHRKFIPGESK